MPDVITGVQGLIFLVLSVAAIALKAWAFVEAVRHKPEHYVAAGKRTKNFWLLVTGLSLAFGIISPNVLSIFSIAGIIGAGIFLADVRPALHQVTGRGGGAAQGPYGAW